LDEVRQSLTATLRGVLFLAVPASVGLVLLRQPIIELLYQRGSFNSHSTELVAWALLWYAAGLIGHSLLEILARAFYALHDTKTPVIVGIIAMGLNVVFSFSFSALFGRLGWMPHGGLALANSLATALESIVLLVLMRKRLKSLSFQSLIKGFGQSLTASLLMGVIILIWIQKAAISPAWLIALGGTTIGAGTYLLTTLIMKVPEVQLLIRFIKEKIV
jgi:putative peptidoglycan lipid II flippase